MSVRRTSAPVLPRRPSTSAAPGMGSAPRLWCFKPSRLFHLVSSDGAGSISVPLGTVNAEVGLQLRSRLIADVGAIYGGGASMACAESPTVRFGPADFRGQGSGEPSRLRPHTGVV